MSGSTLSSDMALGADLGLPQASFSGATGTEYGASATMDVGGVSGMVSDASMSGSSLGIGGDIAGADVEGTSALFDTSSALGTDLTGEAMLDSDDIVADADFSELDVASDMRALGGEDYRSDASSTDTVVSDDLLTQWDSTTRQRNDEV